MDTKNPQTKPAKEGSPKKPSKAELDYQRENLKIEATLFLLADQTQNDSNLYFLEVRVVNAGDTPVEIQAIVCETDDQTLSLGAEDVFISEANSGQGLRLAKRGDVIQENFPLDVPSVARFEAAHPRIFVTTKLGKVFEAEIGKRSIQGIKHYEVGEFDSSI